MGCARGASTTSVPILEGTMDAVSGSSIIVSCLPLQPAAQKRAQLQEAIDEEAKPEVHQGSEVKPKRAVLRSRGKIGVKREVEPIAQQDRHQEFHPLARH